MRMMKNIMKSNIAKNSDGLLIWVQKGYEDIIYQTINI